MKKFLSILCGFILFIPATKSQSVQVFDIEIDTDAFYTVETDDGVIVTSVRYNIGSNDFEPARPYTSVKFLLPDQEVLEEFSFQIQDSIVMENIKLASPPPLIICSDNKTIENSSIYKNGYETKYYPLDVTVNEYDYDGYKYIGVLYTPIAYNAVTRTLSLAKKIRIIAKTRPTEKWNYHYFSMEDNIERLGKMYGVTNPEAVWNQKATPSIVGSVWSYVYYWTTIDGQEDYNFFRYEVLNEPKEIGKYTYYPMVKYTTEQYLPAKEDMRVYLREEGARIFQYLEDEQKDTMLYNFALNQSCPECREFQVVNGEALGILEFDKVTTEDNLPFRTITIGAYNGKNRNSRHEWIDGIGNIRDFFAEYTPNAPSPDYTKGSLLNYYRSGDGRVIYKNPYKKKDGYTDFKKDDKAIPNGIERIIRNKSHGIIHTTSSSLFCTAPDAVKLEVYTMDAIKVGEARFVDGKAAVKVGEAPAMYLYIVTYPDGRRESGKARVSEE